MDVDGTGARELAPWKQPKFYAALGGDEESDLAWSPRGGSIAYSTGADDRIHVVRLSDRRDRALAPGVAPRWSPSGRLIAFLHVDRVDEHFPLQWSLRVVGASGGRLRSLATGQDVALHTWSPRGEIAFAARSSARGNQLYTVSLRRRVRVLTREPKSTLYRALFWSRGGRRVFYDAYVPDDV